MAWSCLNLWSDCVAIIQPSVSVATLSQNPCACIIEQVLRYRLDRHRIIPALYSARLLFTVMIQSPMRPVSVADSIFPDFPRPRITTRLFVLRSQRLRVRLGAPPEVPLEHVHEDLCHEDLLDGVQQHGDLNQGAGEVVGLGPHGGGERDAERRRLGGAAEANGDGLLPGQPADGHGASEERGRAAHHQRGVGDARVDGVAQGQRRAGGVEADDGEEHVERDVHEDVEDDGGVRGLVERARLEGGGEGGPDEQDQAEGRHLGEVEGPQRPVDLLLEEPAQRLADGEGEQHAQPQLLEDVGVHGAERARVRGLPVPELVRLGDEAVDEARGDEGAQDVADDDLDDGRRVVAARGARHDHVGRDGRRETGGDNHADDDGRGEDAIAEAACGDYDVDYDFCHSVSRARVKWNDRGSLLSRITGMMMKLMP